MNAPAHLDSRPRLEDFPYRIADNVRFADLDPAAPFQPWLRRGADPG